MQKLRIILKSGAVIDVKAEKWEIGKNVRDNSIERFGAESVTPHLPYLNLSEIAAILAL
jgi:hypothetical protein